MEKEVERLKKNVEEFKKQVVKLKYENHILLVELGKKRAGWNVPDTPTGAFSFTSTYTIWCEAEMARVREIIEQHDNAAVRKRIAMTQFAQDDTKRRNLEEELAYERQQVALWEKYHAGVLYALQHYRMYVAGMEFCDGQNPVD